MKKIGYSLAILAAVLLSSCKKDGTTDQDPLTKANIVGSVSLYDEGTNQLSNADMTVLVEGTSPVISAITDSTGRFVLPDVPFGVYNLVYEKNAFGTYKRINFEHRNTGSFTQINSTPSLGQKSSTEVTNLSASISGDTVIIYSTTNPAGNIGNKRYLRYFLSRDSNVGDAKYEYSSNFGAQIDPAQTRILKSELINQGFVSGQSIYVKVYGDSFWSNDYDDPNLGRRVFPNLNSTAANAISFIVP